MSMHLVGPHLSTTRAGGKKRKQNNTASLRKAKEEHSNFLKKMGVDPANMEHRLKEKKKYRPEKTESRVGHVPSESVFEGASGSNGFKRENPKYSGDKLLGIAVTHKSNLQPVFSKEQAEETSTMRR